MAQPKANRQLSLLFDAPAIGEVKKSNAEPPATNKTVSLATFRAEKSRRRLVDQLKRSGLLDLKHAKN